MLVNIWTEDSNITTRCSVADSLDISGYLAVVSFARDIRIFTISTSLCFSSTNACDTLEELCQSQSKNVQEPVGVISTSDQLPTKFAKYDLYMPTD
jgi:hypothetical protein